MVLINLVTMFMFLWFQQPQQVVTSDPYEGYKALIEFPDQDNTYPNTLALTFDDQNEAIYMLHNETGLLTKIELNGSVTPLDTLLFSYSDEFHFMEKVPGRNALYFWERGLGEVYLYDLEVKKLYHFSDTSVDKLMYRHGGFVNQNGNIFTQGGYGFWERRHLLLKFDPEREEWLLESKDFPRPQQTGMPNILWTNPDTEDIFYITRSSEELFGVQPFLFSKYNLNKKEWFFERQIFVEDPSILGHGPYYLKHTYRRNPERQITHLFNDIFFDESTSEMKRLVYSTRNKINNFAFFYSPEKSEWVFLAEDNENSNSNIVVGTIPSSEIILETVKTYGLFSYFLKKSYLHVLFVLLLAGSLAYYFVKKRRTHSQSTFRVNKADGHISVYHNGDQIQASDTYLQQTWELILRMKQNNQEHIPVADFDDKIFLDNHSSSFRSKRRKSIIKELNKYHSSTWLETIPNSIDRRYKDIKVDLSVIKIPEE